MTVGCDVCQHIETYILNTSADVSKSNSFETIHTMSNLFEQWRHANFGAGESAETILRSVAQAWETAGAHPPPWCGGLTDSESTPPPPSYAGVELSGTIENTELDSQRVEQLMLFPIRDVETYTRAKVHEAAMWTANEIRFEKDVADYERLSPNQKRAYRLVVGFFQIADAFVSAQVKEYQNHTKCIEEEMFFVVQNAIEMVHQEVYGLAAIQVIRDPEEMRTIRQELVNLPFVRAKWNFALRNLQARPKSLALRFFVGALFEGVFFANLFAVIFLWRRKNVLNQFTIANTWICRDETYHRDNNAKLTVKYNVAPHELLSVEDAHTLAREVMAIEMDHLRYIMAVPFEETVEADRAIGFHLEGMEKYVEGLVDQTLVLSGFPTLFGGKGYRPPWMIDIGMVEKPNFYDTTVTSYAQFSVQSTVNTASASRDSTSSGGGGAIFTTPTGLNF